MELNQSEASPSHSLNDEIERHEQASSPMHVDSEPARPIPSALIEEGRRQEEVHEREQPDLAVTEAGRAESGAPVATAQEEEEEEEDEESDSESERDDVAHQSRYRRESDEEDEDFPSSPSSPSLQEVNQRATALAFATTIPFTALRLHNIPDHEQSIQQGRLVTTVPRAASRLVHGRARSQQRALGHRRQAHALAAAVHYVADQASRLSRIQRPADNTLAQADPTLVVNQEPNRAASVAASRQSGVVEVGQRQDASTVAESAVPNIASISLMRNHIAPGSLSRRNSKHPPGIWCNHCLVTSNLLSERTSPETPAALARCAGCSSVYYCCKPCQRLNWPHHKVVCRIIQRITSDGSGVSIINKQKYENAQHEEVKMVSGMRLAIHYALKLVSGHIFDRSCNPSPGQLIAQANAGHGGPLNPTPVVITILDLDENGHIVRTDPKVIPGMLKVIEECAKGYKIIALASHDFAWGEAGVPDILPSRSAIVIECELASNKASAYSSLMRKRLYAAANSPLFV